MHKLFKIFRLFFSGEIPYLQEQVKVASTLLVEHLANLGTMDCSSAQQSSIVQALVWEMTALLVPAHKRVFHVRDCGLQNVSEKGLEDCQKQ